MRGLSCTTPLSEYITRKTDVAWRRGDEKSLGRVIALGTANSPKIYSVRRVVMRHPYVQVAALACIITRSCRPMIDCTRSHRPICFLPIITILDSGLRVYIRDYQLLF